jgi:hypothetical protein
MGRLHDAEQARPLMAVIKSSGSRRCWSIICVRSAAIRAMPRALKSVYRLFGLLISGIRPSNAKRHNPPAGCSRVLPRFEVDLQGV